MKTRLFYPCMVILLFFFYSCEKQQSGKSQDLLNKLNKLSLLDPGGYKDAKWGMSPRQVKKVSKRELSSDLIEFSFMAGKGAYLQYDVINGNPSSIIYLFSTKGLTAVVVNYKYHDFNYKNSSDVGDFNEIERLLIEKYDEPLGKTRKGTAESIALGDGEYSDLWSFPKAGQISPEQMNRIDIDKDFNTYLTLRLGKTNERYMEGISLTITYVCPSMADIESNQKRETEF